eukprot:6707554-Prymnesium_polylepis.1
MAGADAAHGAVGLVARAVGHSKPWWSVPSQLWQLRKMRLLRGPPLAARRAAGSVQTLVSVAKAAICWSWSRIIAGVGRGSLTI